jgi:hypothetical protein
MFRCSAPPTSWSRTRPDQAKSAELTAFACAFPRLIWATWAVRRRACAGSPGDEAHRRIIFDPILRTDGVEPSDDSLLELCAAVYLLSGRRRRHVVGSQVAVFANCLSGVSRKARKSAPSRGSSMPSCPPTEPCNNVTQSHLIDFEAGLSIFKTGRSFREPQGRSGGGW